MLVADMDQLFLQLMLYLIECVDRVRLRLMGRPKVNRLSCRLFVSSCQKVSPAFIISGSTKGIVTDHVLNWVY